MHYRIGGTKSLLKRVNYSPTGSGCNDAFIPSIHTRHIRKTFYLSPLNSVAREPRGQGDQMTPRIYQGGQTWYSGPHIFWKIIKIVATRCHTLRLKCTEFDFGCGSAADPAGGAHSAPQTP